MFSLGGCLILYSCNYDQSNFETILTDFTNTIFANHVKNKRVVLTNCISLSINFDFVKQIFAK